MANTGDNFEINLLNSVDVDKVRKDVFDFGDKTAPHNANTGIERNGGIANIYEQEVVYSEAGSHYLTEDGHVLSAETVAGNAKIIRVDGKAVGQVSSYGVQSRTEIDGYDDVALTADGTFIAIRLAQTTVTITELSLANVVLNTRSVSFSNLSGLAPYFSSLSIIRYQPMHYVDSQEFALRMGQTVVILKEATPSQVISLGIGGDVFALFPGGASITAVGKYKDFIVFGSSDGRVASFDGQHFRASDGSGIGRGPFNPNTAVGSAQTIISIIEFSPRVDVSYLVIATQTGSGRVASWDGLAWKNYNGTGSGAGPFDNNAALAGPIFGAATYLTRYYVIFGGTGRVASWDDTGATWKNYNGTGSGAGPFDNGTAVGANTPRSGIEYAGRFALGAQGGRLASWLSGAWTLYTAGSGLSNNATVVGAHDIISLAVLGSILFIGGGSNGGRLGSWDGANFKNYDGTGTGTGPSSNAAVVGASSIVKMTVLGTTMVFIGGAGGNVYGSWDGTAFKNSNGTGTGTGIFGATAVISGSPTGGITYTYLGISMIIVCNTGGFTYVDYLNRQGVFFVISGSTANAQLLINTDTAGYLFFYRFEQGSYFAIIEGNSSNVSYLISSTNTLIVLPGKYAIPQVASAKTRMLVVKTPEISGVASIESFFTVGYSDFVTYTTAPVYPTNDTANVNALNTNGNGPVIGYNYVDVLYRTTASATDIRNLYLPNPTPTPIQFWKLTQGNTDTNINGYGKLNNMLGAPTTKPFEFRSVLINGQQSALSVAMIDGLATDALGVLITNVGEWDDTYAPQIVNDDTILYRFDGRFYIVKIGTNIPAFFDKITSDLYKLNTIHPSNLYSDRDEILYASSMDYHGQEFFTATAAPGVAQLVASVLTTQYSNSIDVGDKIVLINPVAAANIDVFGARIPSNYGVALPFAVDTYINDEYSFSTLSNSIEVVLPDKVDTLYIPDDRIPVALGADYFGSTAVIGGVTIILNPDYDGYIIGNDITGTFIAFVLYGQTYLFDSNFIFLAEIQANVLTNTTRIAPADGLIYIASSPTAIWFLSQFDNSLYTFEGGRNLTKAQRFTSTTAIQQGVWSVRDDTLLLETVDSLIWIRDGVITQNTKKSNQTDLQLFETTDGIVISNNATKWRYTYSALAGSTVVPLSLKTAYFGINSNMRAIAKSLIVTVYSPTRAALTITLTHDGYDQDRQYVQSEVFTIKPTDYTQNGYCRLRLQPKDQRTIGSSLQYDCDGYALIQEMVMIFEPEQSAIIAGNRSK